MLVFLEYKIIAQDLRSSVNPISMASGLCVYVGWGGGRTYHA